MKVLRDDFGFVKNRIWEADERINFGYYRDSERGLYKSTAPRVEDLSFYLSYQSLLVVAGDLISSEERYQDPEELDEIQTWVRQYLPTRSDGLWLSDRRDPRPLNARISDDDCDDEFPWRLSLIHI